ncbi:MAG: hypothetical protein ACREDI_10910, partial [Roseiarcus sp.]
MFKLESDVNLCFGRGLRGRRGGRRAAMKSIYRSILARLLQTTALSLALMTASTAGLRAEIVIVQGADGAAGADGVNPGDNGLPGGDGESVAAGASSVH